MKPLEMRHLGCLPKVRPVTLRCAVQPRLDGPLSYSTDVPELMIDLAVSRRPDLLDPAAGTADPDTPIWRQ